MISLSNIHLSFGARALLKGVDLNIQDGECIAVVGPNGCGKSTFLKILAGIEKPDQGTINYPNRTRIGYLPQEADLATENTLQEELLNAFEDVRNAMAEMAELEHEMGRIDPQDPGYERILRRYGEASHLVEHRQGYSLEAQVGRVAMGLGFTNDDLERSCSEFSGGWQMRILLGKLLLEDPDVLLLDEPTNHLDLETILWLEDWIRTCQRTLVMVSHERAFMDRLVKRIVCLESGQAEIYRGDYSHYVEQSALRREERWQAYIRQREEIETIENFIRKFRYNAARASQVQSRVKQLEKVERLEAPFHPTAIHFSFPKAPASYQDVVVMENLGHSYGGDPVFANVNLTITRGERVGLVGVNGAGKSTMLRVMAGREAPTQGRCTIGGKVDKSYFAQYDMSTLSSDETLLQAMQNVAPTNEAHRSRDVLGAFLFSGDDVDKPLRALSGGERTRFRLAQMLFSPANLLLLDEPTNHLDITSRATVEEALQKYTGTVIVVSHDRVFMDRVTNKIIEIEDGRISVYPGKYGDYLAHKEAMLAEGTSPMPQHGRAGSDDSGGPALAVSRPTAAKPQAPARPPVDPKEQRRLEREAQKTRERNQRTLERAVDAVETQIEQVEKRLDELGFLMAEPEIAADYAKLAPLTEEHRVLSQKKIEVYAEWERLQAELADLE